jgi:hypothetical protein
MFGSVKMVLLICASWFHRHWFPSWCQTNFPSSHSCVLLTFLFTCHFFLFFALHPRSCTKMNTQSVISHSLWVFFLPPGKREKLSRSFKQCFSSLDSLNLLCISRGVRHFHWRNERKTGNR